MDFGLLLEPVDLNGFEYIRLNVKERWVATMRFDDPLAAKDKLQAGDLIGRDVILPWRAAVNKDLKSWFGSYYSKMNIRMNCNLSTNAFIMVQNNMGISFNIEGSKPFLERTRFCSLPLYPEFSTTNVLAWKRHQPFSTAAAKFIEFIHQYLARHGDDIKKRYFDYIK